MKSTLRWGTSLVNNHHRICAAEISNRIWQSRPKQNDRCPHHEILLRTIQESKTDEPRREYNSFKVPPLSFPISPKCLLFLLHLYLFYGLGLCSKTHHDVPIGLVLYTPTRLQSFPLPQSCRPFPLCQLLSCKRSNTCFMTISIRRDRGHRIGVPASSHSLYQDNRILDNDGFAQGVADLSLTRYQKTSDLLLHEAQNSVYR